MSKVLMKGNEAIGEAAIKAGCRYFFGYPITPQSELPEYLSRRLPQVGGVYLQAESEVAAINMVYGAASTGARVMTSSSSPGISLKQEGISYLAGSELPCVIVNIMRGGPGLGGIQPSQSDYFQATKGGGHGDYRLLVLAPASVQEIVDLVKEGFDLAEKYRIPVMILGDGILGQMMEPVDLGSERTLEAGEKPWAVTGKMGRTKNIINSLYLDPEKLEKHNRHLERKYQEIKAKETRSESYLTDDAEIVVAAYGMIARVAKAAVDMAREEGIKAGVFRPITLWPYPEKELNQATVQAKAVLTVEMSLGQMVEDVRLSLNGRLPVEFYGRVGGMVPTARAIYEEIKRLAKTYGEVK
ncbi:MAG: 3-methyl-2-oxobutanoate dehydrogenase subunit VorB [Bacillota bacterium]|uniref:3-methyl-2-oxobutanoate dehydrogenase subunit VorB n=1 Tax=Thermanaerosceptrum fracticalcis TaxID=1712410 RepID=A0A7G6E3H4_THEFR|nr:3-methyl-2-oxobutanoate dehydrogenase subunit VorB [Thermanaerosceptrum fracticalcis]QNB46628.1 3-methyl-2-oxobutanoate dehydrogenase subunit VorB [Thermanaerosceptrum fracticalcis]